jgi:hypothetical protein
MAGHGIADRNSVAGVVRAHAAWKEIGRESGLKLAVGRGWSLPMARPMWSPIRPRAMAGAADAFADAGQPARGKGECI